MPVHMISYDLNRPGQKYDELYKGIKSYLWAHYLDSTWFVETSISASEVSDHLLKHIDNTDRLIVIEVTGNYGGWMEKNFWKWLADNLKK